MKARCLVYWFALCIPAMFAVGCSTNLQHTANVNPTPDKTKHTASTPASTPSPSLEAIDLGIIGNGTAETVAWSPDGKLMAVAGSRGIYLYNTENWQPIEFIDLGRKTYNDGVKQVFFHPDGKSLFYTHTANSETGLYHYEIGRGKIGFAKLYTNRNALVAADLFNNRVLLWFEEQNIHLLRTLTDRGTEYCGSIQNHEYQLYLAIENIDHSKTKAKHPQTNGICERFHRTIKAEFYDIAFRKKV